MEKWLVLEKEKDVKSSTPAQATGGSSSVALTATAMSSAPLPLKAPSFRRTLQSLYGNPRRAKHAKHGAMDVYTVVVTTVSGATSDASGNLPGYFNAGGQLVNSGAWSTLSTAFDICRLKKVVFRFQPKLGWTTARAFTPLTATACNMLRIADDPEGALSSPTVANMLARSPCNAPYAVKDHTLVDPFTFTFVPKAPIVRFSATALTATSMHDWMDVGDVTSYAANGTLVGGPVWNVLQAGACPASTDIFGVTLEYTVEFALRNG